MGLEDGHNGQITHMNRLHSCTCIRSKMTSVALNRGDPDTVALMLEGLKSLRVGYGYGWLRIYIMTAEGHITNMVWICVGLDTSLGKIVPALFVATRDVFDSRL